MTWQEAMDKYGSDKPDIRFNMPITDVKDIVKDCEFKVFADATHVRALRVEGGNVFTRKIIDGYTEAVKTYGAKGLAYIQMTEEGPKSPILKFLKEEQVQAIVEKTGAQQGDILFFAADEFEVVCNTLGYVRLACGDHFELRDPDTFAFCWVTDFPLFEWSQEDQRLNASHHPFTAPKEEDIALLDSAPEKVRARAYDLAVNGSEVAGGSIRIHSSELQSKIFNLLGITSEDAQKRFGHILHAFKYGAPPHGGIAWGLDRLIMVLQDEPNIREVIAFPKDQKARDLMLSAPSEMPAEQVAEANVRVHIPE